MKHYPDETRQKIVRLHHSRRTNIKKLSFAEYNLNILGSSFSILIPIIKGFLIISNIT